MTNRVRFAALLSAAAILVAACGSAATPTPAPTSTATAVPSAAATATPAPATPTPAPTVDPNSLLGKILASGKVRISTDPNYAPFSFLDPATNTFDGFDNATAVEAVKRLSKVVGKDLAIDWQTPNWDLITAGSWAGRWDISVGSMSVTKTRAKVVDFVNPYYYDFGSVAVPTASTAQKVADLVNATWCVGASTTYEQWLKGTLEIVDPKMLPVPAGSNVTSLDTDNLCVQAIMAGRKFDALAANENSLTNAVAKGAKIRVLPDVTFTISVAFAIDRSGPDDSSLLPLLNKIVDEMHADGTLTAISMKYLQKDVTLKP